MATTIKTTFQLRRGNAEVWAKNNPVLAAGEPAFELDTGKLKIGNGNDTYNDLPYLSADDVAVLLEDKVSKAGDTMTGDLCFNQDFEGGGVGGTLIFGPSFSETGPITPAAIVGFTIDSESQMGIIADKVNLYNAALEGDLEGNKHRIKNLADGIGLGDAITFRQYKKKVSKTGDTMTGALQMSSEDGIIMGSLSRIFGDVGVALSANSGACLKVGSDAVTVCDNAGGTSQIKGIRAPVEDTDAANKGYVDDTKLIVQSSTAGSTKKFRITVDDAGTLSATEITTT